MENDLQPRLRTQPVHRSALRHLHAAMLSATLNDGFHREHRSIPEAWRWSVTPPYSAT